MERRKVEVESWSPPAVVGGILRRTAANSASNNNSAIAVSDGTAARPSQTDATGATSPYPGPASRPSPPDPVPPSLLTLTSRASADRATGRRTDSVAAENNQMGSSAGRLSSIVSTAKKKHMCRHVVVDILPNPLTPTDKRMNGRTGGRAAEVAG